MTEQIQIFGSLLIVLMVSFYIIMYQYGRIKELYQKIEFLMTFSFVDALVKSLNYKNQPLLSYSFNITKEEIFCYIKYRRATIITIIYGKSSGVYKDKDSIVLGNDIHFVSRELLKRIDEFVKTEGIELSLMSRNIREETGQKI